MAKQYLDAAGVTQVWNAVKTNFVSKTITASQTVRGSLVFSETVTFSKGPVIGKTTIASGTNSAAITVTLPSTGGTLALKGDIPSLDGYATLDGPNTFRGDITFTGAVSSVNGYIAVNGDGTAQTKYSYGSITNNGSVITLPVKAGTILLSTDKGIANGVASLDGSGKVPTANLPSYVDDILDCYATYDVGTTGTLSNIKLYSDSAHKNAITGEGGKEYIDITEGHPGYEFRWTGTVWAQVGGSPLIIGTITGTAYDGGKGTALETKTSTLETNLGKKVDKLSTAGAHLYAHTAGTQNEVSYGTAATANNIVQRDSAGQVNLPTTEPGDNQAVSKKWVESQGYGESDAYVKKIGDTMTGALNVNVGEHTAVPTKVGISIYGTDTTTSGNHLQYKLDIGPGAFTYKVGSNTYTQSLQGKTGTLALLTDIPSLANYAKLDAENMFGKKNRFIAGATISIEGMYDTLEIGTNYISRNGTKYLFDKAGGGSYSVATIEDINALDTTSAIPSTELAKLLV